jgi:glycyl-tRNA synthetase beta chain
MNSTLLIEIGVEELPPEAMRPLAQALADGLAQALTDTGLAHGRPTHYASPRRLGVAIADTAPATAAQRVEKAGPTLAIAFDARGHPTRAGEGFARSLGVSLAALEREDSSKGERLVYRACQPGRALADVLQEALPEVLRTLPIPRRMRWGEGQYSFVRPVHWLVGLHGAAVLPLALFGIAAGRATHGHRFHHPEPIALATADDYAGTLYQTGFVIAEPDARAARIVEQVQAGAQHCGGRALADTALIKEVNALVEWPVALTGTFESRFLVLPREVLIATLEDHQRYFPVEDAAGELMARFVTVANIDSLDSTQVIAGNERVLRARLADALFFWDYDRRVGLERRIEGLARVRFQQALGSLADKSQRVRTLVAELAALTGADPAPADRAAVLAKADLITEMVGEFPELQGVMGSYYAREAGEMPAVARAIAEQYAPAAAGAPIPASAIGRILGLADRLDTLAGIFALGKRPSGDKDPFALRRAALGVLRILIEAEIDLDLAAVLAQAVALQPIAAESETVTALWQFHVERLRGYYSEQGLPAGAFEAVAALAITHILDFDRRVHAAAAFAQRPEAAIVGSAHKRIRNILRRNADESIATLDDALLIETAEQQLAAAYRAIQQAVATAMAAGNYTRALAALAELDMPLDAFFQEVLVMSDKPALRHNRLALLRELDHLCRQVADLSCLVLP